MEEAMMPSQAVSSKLPRFLTTVTPLSKLLALVLFITLPFVGFIFGQSYPRPISPKKVVLSPSTPITPVITTSKKPNQPNSPAPSRSLTHLAGTYSPEVAKTMISDTAFKVINAIGLRDFSSLSNYVDPFEGVSLAAGVCFSPSYAQTFTSQEIKNIPSDNTVYMWGRPYASGLPVKKTISTFIYEDLYDHDFANSPEAHFNEYRAWTGNDSNCLDDYFDDKAIEVEYYFPGTEEYAMHDGASLHLIFTKLNNKWYLRHIANQFWSP